MSDETDECVLCTFENNSNIYEELAPDKVKVVYEGLDNYLNSLENGVPNKEASKVVHYFNEYFINNTNIKEFNHKNGITYEEDGLSKKIIHNHLEHHRNSINSNKIFVKLNSSNMLKNGLVLNKIYKQLNYVEDGEQKTEQVPNGSLLHMLNVLKRVSKDE